MPDLAQRGAQGLAKFYFPLYNKPSLLRHPSPYSRVARIRGSVDGPGFALTRRANLVKSAKRLPLPISYCFHVFGTQIDHFQLGLRSS